MSWDSNYRSQLEQDAERDAALAATQRAKLTHFERTLLDYLGEISQSLAVLAEKRLESAAEVAAESAMRVVAELVLGTANGVDGGASAEPGGESPDPRPGSARPDPTAFLRDFCDWCNDLPPDEPRSQDELIAAYVAALPTP